jgi:SAM-dependent methyltransferase
LTKPEDNRFEDFFNDDFYVSLKNSLYNYRLRRRAVGKCVQKCMQINVDVRILEVGSGLSPMLYENSLVVYSDLSLSALQSLRRAQPDGVYVEADALHLPFEAGTFTTVVCSEVVEHIPDDLAALKEIARVMNEGGILILTFPHRRFYFANDDRFVRHFRRYEIAEMADKLKNAGLEITEIRKVLGPLEKITMMAVIFFAAKFSRVEKGRPDVKKKTLLLRKIIAPIFRILNTLYCLPVWLDARIFPRGLASVILFKAFKKAK